jgi:hypothetical protein
MVDDTPRRKLIKTNQENENDASPILINENIAAKELIQPTFDDDLARKVEECFRNTEQQTDVEMMEVDEINPTKQKSSTRRRSRFRFSFSNNQNSNEEDEQRKSRLSRTHSASIIDPENLNQINSSRRRKSYSTTGLANELKHIPNEPITNLDKVFVIF